MEEQLVKSEALTEWNGYWSIYIFLQALKDVSLTSGISLILSSCLK